MSKRIGGYIGISSVTEKNNGNRGVWNIIDQFYFYARGNWKFKLQATGGTITNVDGYRYHEFTIPGNFDVSLSGLGAEIEVLVQGGGNNGAGGSTPTNSPGGPGGGGGATGVWRLENIESGIYPVSVGGAGSQSILSGNNPLNPQFISSGAGGGNNTTSWTSATNTSSFPGTSGSGPTGFSGFSGGSGGPAGGAPQPSELWWKPFIAPGGGGPGGNHTGSGSPGSPRGGGGGGGGGAGGAPNQPPGSGGTGAPGVVVIRYKI